jgi:hypothetical protein
VLLPSKFFRPIKHNNNGDLVIHVRKRGHNCNFSVGAPSVQPYIGLYGPCCGVPCFCTYLQSCACAKIERSYKDLAHVTFFSTRRTHIYHINIDGYTLVGYEFRRTQHRKNNPTITLQIYLGGGTGATLMPRTTMMFNYHARFYIMIDSTSSIICRV